MRSHRMMQIGQLFLATLVTAPLAAQISGPPKGHELLMHPQYNSGQPVSPVFEGWNRNPDGTYNLTFGFFNRNAQEDLEVPLGPDNFITPPQYDGHQPTFFPSERRGGYIGRGWGVFTITVPADFSPDSSVVWTLTSKGRTHSTPGRINSVEYRLNDYDQQAGVGSYTPPVRFSPDGPEGIGPKGIVSDRVLTGRVGQPVTITVWSADKFDPARRSAVPVDLIWSLHQGPVGGRVVFGPGASPSSPPLPGADAGQAQGQGGGGRPGGAAPAGLKAPAEGGEVSTTATFSLPGEYVLRVEAGNFDARDSSNPDHCCWTNGYVRVNVSP